MTIPQPSVAVQLPAPTFRDEADNVPYWIFPGGEVSAWREGVEIDGALHEDVDAVEEQALAVLAAVRAHRDITS